MADSDKTQLITELLFSTNASKSLPELNKLEKGLTNLATAYEKAAAAADKLTEADKKAAKPSRNTVRQTKNGLSVSWAQGDRGGSRKANELLKQNNDLLKERISLEEQELKVKERRNIISSKNASTRAQEQITRAEKLKLSREKFEHPERGALSLRPRYVIGRGVSSFSNSLMSKGSLGKLAGSVGDVVGKSIISPVSGAVSAISHLGKAVIDLSTSAVEASAQIEMLKTNMGVVFGSQTQATRAFNDVAQYAIKSPFGIEQTTEMAILLKQSGVYASDLMDTLRMIGDTAGGNAEKMMRIANNYAQIVSIGKASMLDMRQFAYAGIPIFEAVSKELNVSQSQLRKMISEGKVTSDIIEKVFKNLTGVNGIFENATERGAKTLKARLQNLQDAKQLALAAIGDNLLSIGEKYGGDSYAMNAVSFAEELFQRLQSWASIKNIEKDISNIANQKNEIQKLEKLIEVQKEKGNTDVVEALQSRLNKLKQMGDIDTERATLAQLYHYKTDDYNDISEKYKGKSIDYLNKEFNGLEDTLNSITHEYHYGANSELQTEVLDSLKQTMDEIKKAIDIYNKKNSVTDEELQAYREETLINAQQKTQDTLEASLLSSGSAFTVLSDFKEEYEKQPDVVAKREEQRKKKWDEALKLLKEVSEHTDESGILQYAENDNLNFASLSNYIKKGILVSERNLQLLKGNNGYNENDIAKARSQYNVLKDVIFPELKNKYRGQLGSELGATEIDLNHALASNENFANEIAAVTTRFEKLVDAIPNEEEAKMFRTIFGLGGKIVSIDKTPLGMVIKEANDFIPQWKRTLSEYLGIPAKLIQSTTEAFKTYTDNILPRTLLGNVGKAGVMSGDYTLKDFENMLAFSGGSGKPRGETSDVFQYDWGGSVKNIMNSTPASKSHATVKALIEELNNAKDMLNTLGTVGLMKGETENLTSSKVMSLNELATSMNLSGDMTANIFGEHLRTASGKDVEFKDGIYRIKETGQIIEQDAVHVASNLVDLAQETIDKINGIVKELELKDIMNSLVDSIEDIGKKSVEDALVAPFEQVGQCLNDTIHGMNTWDEYGTSLIGTMESLADSMLSQIGPAMTNAGFQMIAGGASAVGGIDWGAVAAGAALVAGGGIVGGLGKLTSAKEQKAKSNKNDEQLRKAQDLKDQLADLLAQARSDALYYENNLRHKTALGINKEFSYKSVNDAVISPRGDVITTHPDDYLIATKQPQQLLNGPTIQPRINFIVQNNVGNDIQVKQEKQIAPDGTIQISAIIESVVGDYIASSRSDDAFSAREARGYGNRSIM